MTRFARAKGSKASNERVFSEATPWSEMKNQMLMRKQEVEEEKKRREAEAKRNENYQKFLKERKEETTNQTEWAEFPEENDSNQNGLSKKIKTIKKQKNKVISKSLKKKIGLALESETITDEIKASKDMNGKQKLGNAKNIEGNSEVKGEKPKKKKLKIILDSEATDPDVESQVNEELKPIKKKKSKKNTSLQQNETDPEVEQNNLTSENADDAPIETSSKAEVSEPPIKKIKTKKKKLKNPVSELTDKKKTDSNEGKEAKNTAGKEKGKEIDFDSLPEEDKNKILKKQEKRRKQLEKKKLKKQQIQEQSEKNNAETSNTDVNQEKSTTIDKKKINKTTEKFNKLKQSNEGPDRKKKSLKNQKLGSGEFKRRKEFQPNRIIVNGNEVELEYVDGYPVKKEDAENLRQLKKEMIIKGLPRSEINRTLKLERRKAEKALAREKKNVCFNCRKFGHNLSDCPLLSNKDELVDKSGAGICFKCGSTEHTSFACRVVHGENFKFASCFICKEQGHISRQCPDNARGLYPKGGSCRVCGDVTHLKKDCPRYQEQQRKEEAKFQVGSIYDNNPEDIEPIKDISKKTTRPKIIKF